MEKYFTLQSMKAFLPASLTTSLLLALFYTRSDEIPFLLGCALILGFFLGFAFPRRWHYSWLPLGLTAPVMELLIPALHIHVPFNAGNPGPALVVLLPALAGTTLGRYSRPATTNPLQ